MNIEVANRLQQLRKAKGLSQEELAQILGLSRQAISKWERAETSPDTDNLICLARLYNISIDKLLDTSESLEEIRERITQERIDEISNKNEELDFEDDNEKIDEFEKETVEGKVELTAEEEKLKKKRDELAGNLEASFIGLGIFGYIMSGLLSNDWTWGWGFIFIGIFGGYFLTKLFVNRTYAGVSLMMTVLFCCIVLGYVTNNDKNFDLIFSFVIIGLMFVDALVPIIAFVKFNLRNRKELVLLNEKDELIRLQEKCRQIIEANEKYKKELSNINK